MLRAIVATTSRELADVRDDVLGFRKKQLGIERQLAESEGARWVRPGGPLQGLSGTARK